MRLLILLISTSFIIFSCKEKNKNSQPNDTQKPNIALQSVIPQLSSDTICEEYDNKVIKVNNGGKITLALQFTDDINLSQFKIDIHNNFDCHGHGRIESNTIPWQLIQIEDISGSNIQKTIELNVPTDAAAGAYHLMISATDKVGNEAQILDFTIKIENLDDPIKPEIVLLNNTNELTFHVSDTFFIQLQITDNYSLNNGKLEIEYLNSAGEEFSLLRHFFEANQGNQAVVSHNFKINLSSGNYFLKTNVWDEKNNHSELIQKFIVL